MTDARVAALARVLGTDPDVVVRAPGRVNLIGDHTDYCEGYALRMAIDRDCLLAASRRSDGRVHARSLELPGPADLAADGSEDTRAVEPEWARFVAGAIAALGAPDRRLGADLVITSSVPPGAGLSSSSALSVAAVLALAALDGLEPPVPEVARRALDAEVRATGVPGGLMDQLTSLLGVEGHALLLDFRTLECEPIALPRSVGVVVVHSGQERTLAQSAYADRRADCEAAAARLGLATLRDATPEQVRDDRRARHVVSENQRVLEFARALRTGDVTALGSLMLASHASLRDDFEVSTPELDRLVKLLVEHGAYGARLTGAGFGGCVVALVQRNHADDLVAKVVPRYRAETGLHADAFAVRAAAGATSSRAGPLSSSRTPPG